MKHSIAAVLSALLTLAAVPNAMAQGAADVQGEPALLVADRFVIEAEVLSLDQATRDVTLKTPDGEVIEGVVGPEVKNLAQVHVGDRIRVQYAQSLSVNLKKGAGTRSKSESESAGRAKPGEKPAGTIGRKVHFVADITSINAKTGEVTVKGASGRIFSLTLNNPEKLKGYKVGDQVEGTFKQVVTIGVYTPVTAGR